MKCQPKFSTTRQLASCRFQASIDKRVLGKTIEVDGLWYTCIRLILHLPMRQHGESGCADCVVCSSDETRRVEWNGDDG